ncbi:MAG TPA: serine hydrolase [Acidobacteriota bacterium]|nr:serine hydrolase [Acidobacteriota bacterium]
MAYAWQARHGLSATQYQNEFNSMVSQGYRLIDVCGYAINGTDNYAAIWEQSPGPDWQARHGLSSADHQSLFNSLPKQGYRPISVSGYFVGGSVRYASLWEKSNIETYARHGLSADELQTEYNNLIPQGFRPIDVCGYTVAGAPQFAAIWDKSPIPNWVARHGLSSAEYQSQFTQWSNQGYVLLRVSAYEVGGQLYYTAIWIQGPILTWWARHGIPANDYQSNFNSMINRGFRLVKVNATPANGNVSFASIWHKPYLSDADQTFIRQTVNNFMTTHNVPGASVALTYQGRLVHAEAFGLANQSTNEAVTPNHLFRIASVSKPITSAAIFRLIQNGNLNLGDRIFGTNGILGTTYGTQPYGTNINQITIQHLLEHTSGWATSQDPMFGQFNLSQAGLISWMLNNQSLTYVPGNTYDYLNFGYCLLGRVIEQVSGLTYENYVKQNVLTPCGISDMHIAGDSLVDRRSNEVVYYTQSTWNPYGIKVSRMDAHGGWIASPKELLRFLVAHDRFTTKPDLLTTTTMGTMITSTTAPRPDGTPANYARGWAINSAGNYWHNGDLPGTASILVRTSNEYCWAVLVNSRNDSQLQTMRTDIDNLMWAIIGQITDWPAFDLF